MSNDVSLESDESRVLLELDTSERRKFKEERLRSSTTESIIADTKMSILHVEERERERESTGLGERDKVKGSTVEHKDYFIRTYNCSLFL